MCCNLIRIINFKILNYDSNIWGYRDHINVNKEQNGKHNIINLQRGEKCKWLGLQIPDRNL